MDLLFNKLENSINFHFNFDYNFDDNYNDNDYNYYFQREILNFNFFCCKLIGKIVLYSADDFQYDIDFVLKYVINLFEKIVICKKDIYLKAKNYNENNNNNNNNDFFFLETKENLLSIINSIFFKVKKSLDEEFCIKILDLIIDANKLINNNNKNNKNSSLISLTEINCISFIAISKH